MYSIHTILYSMCTVRNCNITIAISILVYYYVCNIVYYCNIIYQLSPTLEILLYNILCNIICTI